MRKPHVHTPVYFKSKSEHNIALLETAIRALTQLNERNRNGYYEELVKAMERHVAVIRSNKR